MRTTLRLAIATIAITALTVSGTTSAIAQPKDKIIAAITGVSDLLAPAVASIPDADSVAQNSNVDIRGDGKLAIKTQGADDIVVTLPYADAFAGMQIGGAIFNGANSTTYARPVEGGAQVALVATRPDSPTTYPFVVQNGSVATGPSGTMLMFDDNNQFNRLVPTPWARDAKGKMVATRFVVAPDGKAFSQEVDHRAAGVAYPVVADPNYAVYATGVVITFSRFETGMIAATSAFTALWVAIATVGGQLGNKIYHNIWRIQIAAAWEAVHGKCLWVWTPYIGNIETGGYNC